MSAAQQQAGTLKVALFDDMGGSSSKKGVPNCRGAADLEVCLKGGKRWLEIKEFRCHRVSGSDIRNGILERGKFDVIIHPGGEGVAQGKALGKAGLAAVRKFVRDGGGYVGICAGANLASADENYLPHTLGIIQSRTQDSTPEYPAVKNLRGVGTADIELNDAGRQVFGTDRTIVRRVVYANGPLFAPTSSLPDFGSPGAADEIFPQQKYTVLARYVSEVAATRFGRETSTKMTGKVAAMWSTFGSGRVLCISPHPEKPQGPHYMIRNAVRWVTDSPLHPWMLANPSQPVSAAASDSGSSEEIREEIITFADNARPASPTFKRLRVPTPQPRLLIRKRSVFSRLAALPPATAAR